MRTAGLTLRQAALIVGFAYLLNPVPYAEFSIYPKLVIRGNVAQTAANIASHHGLFLVAIFCYLINFIEDIVIAWAQHGCLALGSGSPGHRKRLAKSLEIWRKK